MPIEIERKYLVRDSSFLEGLQGTLYRQGYLSSSPEDLTVVRVRTAGPKAYLTIKSATRGIVRSEYEYEIPLDEAAEMLDHLCRPPLIEKTRYEIECAGYIWEIGAAGRISRRPVAAIIGPVCVRGYVCRVENPDMDDSVPLAGICQLRAVE